MDYEGLVFYQLDYGFTALNRKNNYSCLLNRDIDVRALRCCILLTHNHKYRGFDVQRRRFAEKTQATAVF